MLKILNKFFDFCGSVNKKKFQISIVLGVIQAVCEAMKIPAIMIVLMDIHFHHAIAQKEKITDL